MDLEIKDAIDQRLIFRGELLTALQIDSSDDPREKEMGNDAEFMTCQLLLHELERTMPLGKPVEESCSVKIQRRLASSVPPRPMVKIGFNDALTFLTRLCQDAVNMKQLLHYSGSNNLLVSSISIGPSHVLTSQYSDISMGIPIPQARTLDLYSVPFAIDPLERDEIPQNYVDQAILVQRPCGDRPALQPSSPIGKR